MGSAPTPPVQLRGEAGDLGVAAFPHVERLDGPVREGGCVPVAPVFCGQGGDAGGDGGDRVSRMEINSIEHMFVPYQHPETQTRPLSGTELVRALRRGVDRDAVRVAVHGLWRSEAARLTGGQEVAGSNPASPTERTHAAQGFSR